jgi:hypothetical protein
MAEEERDEWGAIILDDRAVPGEAADLGRAVDVGFGEITEDPVGAAQRVPQLVQEGEIPGLEIQREPVPISPFPMEPGESRAAQELPEMFGTLEFAGRGEPGEGKFDIPFDPLKPLSWIPSGLKSSGVGATLSPKDALQISAAGMTMFDPAEIGSMLLQRDPETGERKWPEFNISQAPDGTLIVGNTKNGARAVINRPGMSTMDAMQMLGITAAFTPAARATAAVEATFPRIMTGGLTAGITEDIIQRWQEAGGGDYDPGDVAAATALGPIIDIARPALGLAQRTGRFIGSYFPENMFGGLEAVIPETKAQVLNFAKKAKEYLQSGREAIVTTQDAVPEAHTPFRQILLKMVERMPLTGTGALRVAQREQRVEVLRHLADRYNLNPNTNYGATVIRELNAGAGEALTAAREVARESAEALQNQRVNIVDFRKTMTQIVNDEKAYGELADTAVLDLLERAQRAVWQGGKRQDFGRGFGVIDDWVQRLRMEAGKASPRASASLNEAANALESDLRRTAVEEGGEAGARWVKAMDDEARLVAEASGNSLRSLIAAGEIDQQVIRRVLKSGNVKDMDLMYQNMGTKGRNAARQMILRNATKVAGWRRGEALEAAIDPVKMLKWLDSEAVDAQLKTFFPGKNAQAELNGMREYLRTTAAAGQIGKGVGMAAAGGLGQISANALNLITLGLVGAAGHAYQSRGIRNLLLRLEHVKGNVRAKDAIMKELTPALMAGGRQMMQLWTETDPQDMVLASTEFVEGYTGPRGEATTERLNPQIGVREPGEVEPGLIEQLRQAVGYEPGQGIGQLFGIGEEEAAPEE